MYNGSLELFATP